MFPFIIAQTELPQNAPAPAAPATSAPVTLSPADQALLEATKIKLKALENFKSLNFDKIEQSDWMYIGTYYGSRILFVILLMTLAWTLYIDDFNDQLPPNETSRNGGREGLNASTRTWIAGNAFTDTSTTNIERGVLFPYNQQTRIYKCPADRSTVRDEGRIRRVRSVALSSFMNDIPEPDDRTCWHRFSQIRSPAPVEAITFIDEHEGSIENARFVISPRGSETWVDFPATRHQNAGVLTFADGHAELIKWLEPSTIRAGKLKGWIQGIYGGPKDRDLQRFHRGIPAVPL